MSTDPEFNEIADPKREASYSAPAVTLACTILGYLAGYRHSHATLTEIAAATEANKTSCMRVLRTLEREGFIHYDETSRHFSLGAYLFVLGNRAAEQADVLSAALPALRDAARATGYSCVLVQRQGFDHLMYVAREEPDDPIRVSVAVGQRFAITAGSHGKVFLAHMPPSEAARVLASVGLPGQLEGTTDAAHYLEGLEEVRQRGYAVSIEEHVVGVSGVAAPIFDATGHVVLTLSAIGIAASLNAEASSRVGSVLVERAAAASQALGWRGADWQPTSQTPRRSRTDASYPGLLSRN